MGDWYIMARRTALAFISLLVILAGSLLMLGQNVHAAAPATDSSSLVQNITATQRFMATGAVTATSVVKITDTQTQDFFSSAGDTVITTDAEGHWSNMQLTPLQKYKTGAVTLNMRIDMTKGFHFNWQVKDQAPVNSDGTQGHLGDGIGFALHPVYLAGVTTPANEAEMGTGQTISQDLHSVGNTGGNLGIADLMNVIGFKIDAAYNNGFAKPASYDNTFFHDPLHLQTQAGGTMVGGDAYSTADNIIDGSKVDTFPTDTLGDFGPYAMFTKTDATGYMSNTGSMNSKELTPLDGADANAINLKSGNWYNMTIDYTTRFHELTVTLSDPKDTARSMTWVRDFIPAEVDQINQKQYYAFAIVGSSGMYYSNQAIQHLSGSFTPEPTTLVRQTTTNGASLAATQTVTQQQQQKLTTSAPVTLSSSLSDSGFQGRLSHILFTYYDAAGNEVTKRVDTKSDSGFSRTAANWQYVVDTSKYSALTMVTYVYRRTNSQPTLTFAYDGGAAEASKVVAAGADVQVSAVLTNPNNGPATWTGPYALDLLPAALTLKTATANVTTDASNRLKIAFGNVAKGTPATQSFTLHNNTTLPITLLGGGAAASASGMTVGQNAYIYDASPDNIDTTGAAVPSSYWYVDKTLDAPLGSPTPAASAPLQASYIDIDPGNFVPHVGNAQPAASAVFHFWDITANAATVTTMDPAKSGHPTTDIAGTAAGTLTGSLAAPITKAPAPAITGYDYLGYYEWTSAGSTWHATKNDGSIPQLYFQSVNGAAPQQTIAYIFRPSGKKYLSIAPPDISFGQHPVTTASQTDQDLAMTAGAQATVTDTRPNKDGVPATQGWQVTVQAGSAMQTADHTGSLTGAALVFAAPTSTNTISPSPTLTGGTLSLVDGSTDTVTLAQTSGYAGTTLTWPANGIHLTFPQQSLHSGDYSATIVWSVAVGP